MCAFGEIVYVIHRLLAVHEEGQHGHVMKCHVLAHLRADKVDGRIIMRDDPKFKNTLQTYSW